MGDPTRFDAVVEAVEALPLEEQEMLVDLIRRRWTEQRRAEIGAAISQSLEEYQKGEVGRGTLEDLFRQTEE